MPQVTSTRTAPTRGGNAQGSRLPRHPGSGGRRVGEGLVALLGSLVLVVGVPAASKV